MGSIIEKEMYPMDFEEFLMANKVGMDVIDYLRNCCLQKITPSQNIHDQILKMFKTYLYVGGLPDAIKAYIDTKNVFRIREVQEETHKYYSSDASKYDHENSLKIKRIYDIIPSNIENKVKRVRFNDIENIKDSRFVKYQNEFDYLISSGIALDVKAISEPRFPLIQSSSKNLIKLYFNDVGILTNILYKYNINAILSDKEGINLGAVYETVVAQELIAHGHNLYYYDRRKVGKVDYLVDDYDNLCPLPIEVKSGRDGYEYSAISKMLEIKEYHIKNAYIFSNDREIKIEKGITHLPIYLIMFV